MTANQIYTLVNSAAAQSVGASAITVTDTSTLVSLGDKVLSSTTDIEQFYSALLDRIGRVVIAVRNYRAADRSVKREDMEWGCILQKISYTYNSAVANPSWVPTPQADPFDVNISTTAIQKLFSVLGTWSHEDSIPDYQLFSAFTSADKMAAFISGIYQSIENSLQVEEEALADLAVATNIAGIITSGTSAQKRALVTEYNALTGSSLTSATALFDDGFLAYACGEILMTSDYMKKMSVLYNADGLNRFTPTEDLVCEMLSGFDNALATRLRSNTYHEKLIKLPRYEVVSAWQGTGTGGALTDRASIKIKEYSSGSAVDVEQGNIIAFMHDRDSCASIITRMRDHSIYNPRAERLNIFKKADKGYAVDLSENGVVFLLA